jgi:transposase
LTTKIHPVVDALQSASNPSDGRSRAGVTRAETLLAEVGSQALIADKAYDADGFIAALTIRRIERVTPPKTSRKGRRECDFALCSERKSFRAFLQCSQTIPRHCTLLRKGRSKLSRRRHLACALAWLK